MEFVRYYRSPLEEYGFYKLREDGHLFCININDITFEDVSLTEEYQTCWEDLDKDIFYESLLFDLERDSSSALKMSKHEGLRTLTDIVIGDEFDYYAKNNKVIVIDNNYNQYEVGSDFVFTVLQNQRVDKTWTKLRKCDVIPELMGLNTVFHIKDMELYHLDDRILGCASDMNQYIFSKHSGLAWLVDEKDAIDIGKLDALSDEERKEVTEVSDFYQKTIELADIPKLQKLNEFLNKQKEESISWPLDFVFYKSPDVEEIVALDNDDNPWSIEYGRLTQSKNLDANEIKSWKRVDLRDVWDQISFTQERNDRLLRMEEPTAYDLELFKDKDDRYYGSFCGLMYSLSTEGEFVPEEDIDVELSPVDIVEVLNTQALYRDLTIVYDYLFESIAKLEEQGIFLALDLDSMEFLTNEFYFNFDEYINFTMYYKDADGKEFSITTDGLVPIDKGSITDEFTKFSPQCFRHYFRLLFIEEE